MNQSVLIKKKKSSVTVYFCIRHLDQQIKWKKGHFGSGKGCAKHEVK